MAAPDPRRVSFEAFLDGMHRADTDALANHLADDVVLNSPIIEEPILGRQAVLKVLTMIGQLTDDLTLQEILVGDNHLAASFRLQISETAVSGMDYARFNADNQIVELTAFWRPLPAIVAMQGHIAPHLGAPALQLVSKQ